MTAGRFLCLLLFFGAASSKAAFMSAGLYVFGDSLSDEGNIGVFSNGRVWTDFFAEAMGLEAPGAVLRGGTSFAFGGAQSGPGNFGESGTPNLGLQIDTLAEASGGAPDPAYGTLLWIGGNDARVGRAVPEVVADIGVGVRRLAGLGLKHFHVNNLPPLGETIEAVEQGRREELNAWSAAFNVALRELLVDLADELGVEIRLTEVDRAFRALLSEPERHGILVTQESAARVFVPGEGVVLDPLGVGDVNAYLYYDALHPTERVHAFIAGAALAARPVPEPERAAVLVSFLAAIAVRTRRSRRNWRLSRSRRGASSGGA